GHGGRGAGAQDAPGCPAAGPGARAGVRRRGRHLAAARRDAARGRGGRLPRVRAAAEALHRHRRDDRGRRLLSPGPRRARRARAHRHGQYALAGIGRMSEPFPDPRALLRKHGLAAKKSWGQNFLVAERAYRAIVDAAVDVADDWIVELGAGLGTLTMRLAERVPEGKVIAVERDRDMAQVLRAELAHLDNVEIVEANALTYDLAMIARWHGGPISVCGNL